MFGLNTAQTWVIIIVGIILISYLVYKFVKRGGKIKIKDSSFSMAGNESTDDPKNKQLSEYVNIKLQEIREQKFKRFLTLLRNEKIPYDGLVSHEDARLYYQCLGNIVFSGNGIRSIKSIIERELILGNYNNRRRKEEKDLYIDTVVEECMRENTKYLNHNYPSEMIIRGEYDEELHLFAMVTHKRTISCEALFDSGKVEESKAQLTEDIYDIFEYAESLNNQE